MITNVQDHKKFIDLFPAHWMNAGKAEQEISLLIYQFLAKKIHPNEKLLASELPYDEDEICDILEPLSAGVYRDEGNIIGFAGLTTHEMTHAIRIEGITTYAWCALDTLFIPQLLGKKADIRSKDIISRNPVSFSVNVNEIHGGDQKPLVSLVDPDTEKLSNDIVSNFCHFVYFFESEDTYTQWASEHPNTYLVSLEEAMEIGLLMNRTRYNQFFK